MSKSFNPKTAIIAVIFATILLLIGIKYKNNFHNDIDGNKGVAEGEIYLILDVSKSFTEHRYKYEFKVEDKFFNGETRERLNFEVKIGDLYPVEYSLKNPEHNRMIFDEESTSRKN